MSSSTNITISVNPPSASTGTPTYTVTATPIGGGPPLTVQTTSGTLTLPSLAPETSYLVTVTSSTQAAGTSPSSLPVLVTTQSGSGGPSAGLLDGVLVADMQVIGGNAVVSLNGETVQDDTKTVMAIPVIGGAHLTATTSGTSVTLSGLASGSYMVVAYRQTATQTSAVSSPVQLTVDQGASLSNSTVFSNGTGVFDVAVPPGTSPASYTLTAVPVNGGAPVSTTGSSSPLTVTGLQGGTQYRIVIVYTDTDGKTSPPSAPSVISVATT